MSDVQAPSGSVHQPTEHSHPGPREYIRIAIVLAVVTAFEIGLYYVKIPDGVLVGTLLVLSAIKFFLVAMWFMHLRFDAKIFRRLFVLGIVLAALVYAVVLATFRVFFVHVA